MIDDPAPPLATSVKPEIFFFRKKSGAVKLSPERARRQGDITRLAYNLLGGRDATLAFLNSNDEVLGGRPIDLAVASSEGHAAVARVIRDRSSASGFTEL